MVTSARRGGITATVDVLNKYFLMSEMLVVSANYCNMVHGHEPEEVEQDLEGFQILRTLGRNMAWMLKCIKAGEEAGVKKAEGEAKIKTSYSQVKRNIFSSVSGYFRWGNFLFFFRCS